MIYMLTMFICLISVVGTAHELFNMFVYLTFAPSVVHELFVCLVILHLLLVQYVSCF